MEELRFFKRDRQVRLEKLLRFPKISARYDPWRRGERPRLYFLPPSSPKNDCNMNHMTRFFHEIRTIQKIVVVSPFWRSYEFLSVMGRCVLKSYYDFPDFQLVTTLGGGVKE